MDIRILFFTATDAPHSLNELAHELSMKVTAQQIVHKALLGLAIVHTTRLALEHDIVVPPKT